MTHYKNYDFLFSLRIQTMLLLGIFGVGIWIYENNSILILFLILLIQWFFSCLGTIGYHRWLSHRQFEPSIFGEILMFFGLLLMSINRPLPLVVAHRLHHAHSDDVGDPHSPKYLSLWKMLMGKHIPPTKLPSIKDIYRLKNVIWFDKHYWKIWWTFNIVLCVIDWQLALIMCPLCFLKSWIIAQFFNYYGHSGKMCKPTNLNKVFQIISVGELLHKNHHDDPKSYKFSKTKNEFDLGGLYIELFLQKRNNFM